MILAMGVIRFAADCAGREFWWGPVRRPWRGARACVTQAGSVFAGLLVDVPWSTVRRMNADENYGITVRTSRPGAGGFQPIYAFS